MARLGKLFGSRLRGTFVAFVFSQCSWIERERHACCGEYVPASVIFIGQKRLKLLATLRYLCKPHPVGLCNNRCEPHESSRTGVAEKIPSFLAAPPFE